MEDPVDPAVPSRLRRGLRRSVTFAVIAAGVGIPGSYLYQAARRAQAVARSLTVT